MSNIGIIGFGFVGRAVEYGFRSYDKERKIEPKHSVLIYDKFKNLDSLNDVLEKSEIIFICLPTPFNEKELKIDLTIIDNMMEEIAPKLNNKGKIVTIKSTVIPGTTKLYANKYPHIPFAFNPEFLTEANYLQDFVNADRIVIGADNNWVSQKLTDLYRENFPTTPILKMSCSAAEIVKYQCNILLAAKVGICNVFYDLCTKEGVNYNDVKKAVSADIRIGTSHIDVTTERGFGGKCFPKDLGAIIGACRELKLDYNLLQELFDYNLRIRKNRDWDEIAGASVGGRQYN